VKWRITAKAMRWIRGAKGIFSRCERCASATGGRSVSAVAGKVPEYTRVLEGFRAHSRGTEWQLVSVSHVDSRTGTGSRNA
jgi:hypothetical protein